MWVKLLVIWYDQSVYTAFSHPPMSALWVSTAMPSLPSSFLVYSARRTNDSP